MTFCHSVTLLLSFTVTVLEKTVTSRTNLLGFNTLHDLLQLYAMAMVYLRLSRIENHHGMAEDHLTWL